MKKVKIFNAYSSLIEEQVNNWLKNNPNIEIVHVKYSTCPDGTGSVLHQVLFLYSEEVKI